MEGGEVEAMTSPFWSSIRTARPDWIPRHLVRCCSSRTKPVRISSVLLKGSTCWTARPARSCCGPLPRRSCSGGRSPARRCRRPRGLARADGPFQDPAWWSEQRRPDCGGLGDRRSRASIRAAMGRRRTSANGSSTSPSSCIGRGGEAGGALGCRPLHAGDDNNYGRKTPRRRWGELKAHRHTRW